MKSHESHLAEIINIMHELNSSLKSLSFLISEDTESAVSCNARHCLCFKTISRRETEVIYLVCIGKTYPEIAIALGIKLSTVKFHMRNVVRKLEVSNAKQAIRRIVEWQLMGCP